MKEMKEKKIAVRKKAHRRKHRSAGDWVFDIFNVIFMLAVIAICFYPFWYVFVVSINDNSISSYINVVVWPKALTLKNYEVVFQSPLLLSGFKIATLRTIIATALSVVLGGGMAYALSRKELVGRTFFNVYILITMYLSGGIIPLYLLFKDLSLLNTFAILVISGLFNTWNIILMRTSIASIPDGMVESARIDGANDLTIYFRLIIPCSKPIFATITLFTAVAFWNDWFAGDMFIRDDSLQPIQTIMMRIINNVRAASEMINETGSVTGSAGGTMVESVKMASVMLTVIPIVMIYPFLQKYFVKGIMIGSLKG